MEGEEKSRGDERSEKEAPDQRKGFCTVPRRVKEFLLAIVVTVLGAFTVKGIEIIVSNARANLTSSKPANTGLRRFFSFYFCMWYKEFIQIKSCCGVFVLSLN